MANIQIDYINGTHGSFLMHTVNNLANGTCILPFVKHQAGSAHKLIPYANKIANGRHYSVNNEKYNLNNVVQITMDDDDMLMVIELLMHRWNHFDPDNLNSNTYYKFNSSQYRIPLMRIYEYYNVELKSDIPRHILRDYFTYNLDTNFRNNQLGKSLAVMLTEQKQMFDYSGMDVKVLPFKFKWFYDYNNFKKGIELIKDFFNLDLSIDEEILSKLHSQFLNNNPALGMNSVFDIFEKVKNNISVEIPKLRLLQEAWLNLQIEKLTNKSMNTIEYFKHTNEIYKHLNK